MDYNNRDKSKMISLHLHVVVSGNLFEIIILVESSMKDEGLHSLLTDCCLRETKEHWC
jgi:hypothetical protein